jgi:hypothetical protein
LHFVSSLAIGGYGGLFPSFLPLRSRKMERSFACI